MIASDSEIATILRARKHNRTVPFEAVFAFEFASLFGKLTKTDLRTEQSDLKTRKVAGLTLKDADLRHC